MRKLFVTILLASLMTPAFSQFPGGGPPGGGGFGNRGGGMGRPGQEKEKTFIPGTADDDTPRGNGKINGILMDSTTNKPVEYATIALINTQTNKPIDGTTSDQNGKFSLTRIAVGNYSLRVSFLGYQNKDVKGLKIEKGTTINLGNVILAPDVRTLAEVNVVGQAAVIEEKVDRLVYNAEKDITAKGGDATDIMRKVPMLQVDLDGNVSLRGSQNVRVLINNKPSTIVAASVADALKQIPADMIKSVEVITSPSAKYDAEGSAGIINIVTKKNTLQGATLNVDGGVGNRGSTLALNGSLRVGKMGFNLGGFGRAMYNVVGAFENTQTTSSPAGRVRTVQSASTLMSGAFGNYQLGWDYDLDKNTSLSANVRYGLRSQNNFQDNLLSQTFLPMVPTPVRTGRDVRIKDFSGTVDANVSFTRTYKPQQELSVLGLYSRNNRTNNFVADLLNGVDMQTITSRQKNVNLSYNQESTIQVDYQSPIKKTQLIEFGGKGIFRQVNSDFEYFFATGNGNFQQDNTRPANELIYDQNVMSSYLSYTYATRNKYTFKVGTRYEYTLINARFNNRESGQLDEIPDYGNLVPSINISKGLKGGKILKIAYNRRIQRPGIQFLNPNRNEANPTNISQGNPYLNPELTDNFEFSASGSIKAFYVNTSLFYRRTANSITSVRDTININQGDPANPLVKQAILTTFQNIGLEEAYGMNVFTNVTLFSRWQIGGGFDLYQAFLTDGNNTTNRGWVLGGRLFSSLTLKNGWGIQGFGGGRGRQVQLQGYQGGFAFYNLGVKKDFKNKRGSIGLAAENFFNHPFRVRSRFESPILTQQSVMSMYNAGVRMTFSYRLGKMSFDGSGLPFGRRKKSVNNDDVKDGDGGGDQGGAPQGGGRGRQ